MSYVFLTLILTLIFQIKCDSSIIHDPFGYVIFCPCMGRFGNQADQFLGAFAFAKNLNRTLVLPHWVEYPQVAATSLQIPFDTYFQVEPLREYGKVVLMSEFMDKIAPSVWPKGKRSVFCYSSRANDDSKQSCNAKEGNPFGPYWSKFSIDFDSDEFFAPLGFDLDYGDDLKKWQERYPAERYPVLAFAGAPGSFPVAQKNVHLQKYLKWSDAMNTKADLFLKNINKNDEKIIGIHLRNGIDFKRACEHAQEGSNFFASAQCLGFQMEHGKLTQELCMPSEKSIIKQLGKVINKIKAKVVYIAADDDHMIKKFQKKFPQIKFHKLNENHPHTDLCILGKVDYAILNCVSTFSAFVKRERDAAEDLRPSEFWSFKSFENHLEL